METKRYLKTGVSLVVGLFSEGRTIFQRHVTTPINLMSRSGAENRRLEIGPGDFRIEGFETLNIVGGRHVDYVLDCTGKLPFKDGSFNCIYASHVLEHIPWYQVPTVLGEWFRILGSQGSLEIWVPDGLKVCQTLIDAETTGMDSTHLDGWYKFNEQKDPCVWAAGRIFSYGDGTGDPRSPNWHRSLFTPQYLKKVLTETGFCSIELLSPDKVRGYDHGWISLGIKGVRP